MKLFDFFKKKRAAGDDEEEDYAAILHNHLLTLMTGRLTALAYSVNRPQDRDTLLISDTIEIAPSIGNISKHPNAYLIQLDVFTFHPLYFPKGIEVGLLGVGEDLGAAIASAVNNYMETIFPPIMASLACNHHPGLDFFAATGGRQVLWHSYLGALALQGREQVAKEESFFDLLQGSLKESLPHQKLNWLKIFVARQATGELTVECLLNNEPWETGSRILQAYAQNWGPANGFMAQKQFIMFRRCDKYDLE